MAGIGTITVPVDFQMTDTAKDVLRGVVAGIMREALEGSVSSFPNEDALRTFVRAEVRKYLDEEVKLVLAQGPGRRMV